MEASEAQPVKAAMLGAYHVHARGKIQALQQAPGWNCVGVWEPEEEVRQARRKQPEFEAIPFLNDLEQVLSDEAIEAVFCQGRWDQNVELAKQALEAGKHVHIDKAPGRSFSAFRDLWEAAQRRSLHLQVGYQWRYNPAFRLVRDAATAGALGEQIGVRAHVGTRRQQGQYRREMASYPGGIVFELAGHVVDYLVGLWGEPAEVSSFLVSDDRDATGLECRGAAVLRYDDGRMAIIEIAEADFDAGAHRSIELYGTEGYARLSPFEPPQVHFSLKNPWAALPAGPSSPQLPEYRRYLDDIGDLASAIRTGEPLRWGKKHDLSVHRTFLKCCGVDVDPHQS